jgi:hypothetical protein
MSNAVMKKNACTTSKKEAGMQKSKSACASPKGATKCAIPQCQIRIEECSEGCKIYCICEDGAACEMLQKLCRSMACECCKLQCMRDGVMCCECCFDCCECSCEMMANGVCLCCKTTDAQCREMIQAMCRCLCCCCECGCECTVCINYTPVCCCEC